MRVLALIPLLLAAGCGPGAPTPPALFKLDCSLSHEALAAHVLSQPGLRPTPPTPGEPYRFYTSESGSRAYVFTQPGAPGHPAILAQESAQRDGRVVMTNTGCPYGDRAGYDALMTYLEGLKTR